jgi:transcriptional regulator with GAF, ATPase, and Fis domain
VLSPTAVIPARLVSVLGATSVPAPSLPSLNLRHNMDWTERETVRRALELSGGVKKDAAEQMGISQRALSYYLAKHRID